MHTDAIKPGSSVMIDDLLAPAEQWPPPANWSIKSEIT
jgi:hypothetical protein